MYILFSVLPLVSVSLTRYSGGRQYATLIYDFGETRSDGKYTDREGEHILEYPFVIQNNKVMIRTSSDIWTFDMYGNTVKFERKNFTSGEVLGSMTGRKVK